MTSLPSANQIAKPERSYVIRVLIASPGDCKSLRDGMKFMLERWNATHGKAEGVTLVPLRYEEDSVATSGVPGQTAINEQVVSEAHACVAFFRSKLGTPTAKFKSGTAEEIDLCIKRGLKVGLLFWDDPDTRIKGVLKDLSPSEKRVVREKRKLAEYRAEMGVHTDQYYYKPYSNDIQAVVYGLEAVLLQVKQVLKKPLSAAAITPLGTDDKVQLDELMKKSKMLNAIKTRQTEAANADWQFKIDTENGRWGLRNNSGFPLTLNSYSVISMSSGASDNPTKVVPLTIKPSGTHVVDEQIPDDGFLEYCMIRLNYNIGKHEIEAEVDNDNFPDIEAELADIANDLARESHELSREFYDQ